MENKITKLEIEADVNNLDEVLAFVDEQLEKYYCPPKVMLLSKNFL